MLKNTPLNGMDQFHRTLLLNIHKDIRKIYSSRRSFDDDFRRLRDCSYEDLYHAWRQFNQRLVDGESPCCDLLTVRPCDAIGIRGVRQLLGIFSRLEGFCDPAPFIQTYAQRIKSSRAHIVDREILVIARRFVKQWIGPVPCLMELYPKHGPGAVSTGERGLNKATFSAMYKQLLPFGGDRLLHLNDRHHTDDPQSLSLEHHPITKVVSVPKDFLKTRIISCEPLTLQFLQQGVMRYMIDVIERRSACVHFRDQSLNAKAAKALDIATIDLSNASDTVSRRIVKQLFPDDWCNLLFALRSHFARLPDGTLVPIRSFAPMGSALCFPVEAIVFAAIVQAVLTKCNCPLNRRQRVHVYGDDIIVPLEYADDVIRTLTFIGFEPNVAKCCTKGVFRESCGAEWYNGHDVTITRPRSLRPMAASKPGGLPMVDHANSMVQHGFFRSAQMLADLCEFPVAIGERSGYASPFLIWKQIGKIRYNRNLQKSEQQCVRAVETCAPSWSGAEYKMLFMHLASGWSSTWVPAPHLKVKRRWTDVEAHWAD